MRWLQGFAMSKLCIILKLGVNTSHFLLLQEQNFLGMKILV